MNKYRILKQHIEDKYRELAEVSGEGELTPEGRGFLIGLESIIQFIKRLDRTLIEKDSTVDNEYRRPRYCWNNKTHEVLNCYGCYIEELDSEEDFLKTYEHRKVFRENNITWLY